MIAGLLPPALKIADEVAEGELGDALFDAIIAARSGTAITQHAYEDVCSLISHPDRKVHLAVPSLLEWLGGLDPAATSPREDYPFVLAAGQRRMFNANQIFRDPAWRRDDPDGALLINGKDLQSLGANDGNWIAVTSPAGRLSLDAGWTTACAKANWRFRTAMANPIRPVKASG